MSDLNIEKILNIYNYFDGIMVTDEKGVIKYYTNFRTDVYRNSSGLSRGGQYNYAGAEDRAAHL